MDSLPTVSALMAAYNDEQYVGRAIESALEQEYPPELLDVVVIDDGSTDSTADIVRALAEGHPGRVRLIQQANGGYVAATNRALAEGTGELLAHENVATQSSIMIRASLRDRAAPIPAAITYADWWITLRSAQFSAIDYSREPLAFYRVHGSNLTGDVTGAVAVREARKSVAFQLWALRNLPLSLLDPEEMVFVWNGIEAQAQRMVQAAGTFFVEPADPAPDLAAGVDGLLADADRLAQRGDYAGEAEQVLRALADDPGRLGSRERLQACTTAIQAAASLPDPLAGARGFVALVEAEELLAGDDMLLAYAEALAGSDRLSLAIDATRLPAELAGAQLRGFVERCELETRDDIELFAVVRTRDATERHRLMAGIGALYRREAVDGGRPPVFTPATLSELRALADRAGD